MAGHRKRSGQPRRAQPGQRARVRLSAAVTAEEQLAAAYDLFRSAARHAPAAARPGLMRRAAEFLAGLAAENGGH